MKLKEGFYRMSGRAMGKVKALSYGGAKELLRTPAHYRAYKDKKRKPPTDEMRFGVCVHWLLFQPEKFEEMVFEDSVVNASHNSNEWRAWRDSLPEEAIVLPAGDGTPKKPGYDKCFKMEAALQKKQKIMAWLKREGEAELTGLFQDRVHGFWWKIRPDWLTYCPKLKTSVVMEYKTDTSAAIAAFVKKICNLEYHLQPALYGVGASEITGHHHRVAKWIVQEKEEPFEARLFTASPYMLDEARVTLGRIAERYAHCLETDEWPGYPDEDVELDLPGWKINERRD